MGYDRVEQISQDGRDRDRDEYGLEECDQIWVLETTPTMRKSTTTKNAPSEAHIILCCQRRIFHLLGPHWPVALLRF